MNSVYLDTNKISRFVEAAYQKHLTGLGVDVITAHCLCILHENRTLRASELAQAVGFAPTSFTQRLDTLEKRGLIQRCPDLFDGRVVRLGLTESGAALAATAVDRLTAAHLEISRAFAELQPGVPRLFMTRYAPISADLLPASMPE